MAVVVNAVSAAFNVTDDSSQYETVVYAVTGLQDYEVVRPYLVVNGVDEPVRDRNAGNAPVEFTGPVMAGGVETNCLQLRLPGGLYRFIHPAQGGTPHPVSIVRFPD